MADFPEFFFIFFGSRQRPLIELDDGKIYRKPLYLMVKTMVSCRFSLKPIHWAPEFCTWVLPGVHFSVGSIWIDAGACLAHGSARVPEKSGPFWRVSGWWFGTFFIFPYIGNNHPNWRTHIFQRGWNHQLSSAACCARVRQSQQHNLLCSSFSGRGMRGVRVAILVKFMETLPWNTMDTLW